VNYAPEDDQDDETEWFWEPELAESWEFDDDGEAVTFELREDVLFHDGSPFDAEAAEWNYLRLRDHDLSRHRTRLEPIIEVMSVEGEYTFRVEFFEPSADPVLFQFVHPLVSMQAVEELGDDEYGQNPVGTGPFQFVGDITEGQTRLNTSTAKLGGQPPTADRGTGHGTVPMTESVEGM
jgi:peptide/nickel transport system substrate-binding protein